MTPVLILCNYQFNLILSIFYKFRAKFFVCYLFDSNNCVKISVGLVVYVRFLIEILLDIVYQMNCFSFYFMH